MRNCRSFRLRRSHNEIIEVPPEARLSHQTLQIHSEQKRILASAVAPQWYTRRDPCRFDGERHSDGNDFVNL